MRGQNEKLERRWHQAIAALLTQNTIAQAATAAGIDETTMYRWLKDPDFSYAYFQARSALLERALGHIAEGLIAAAATLREIVDDREASPTSRVNAAKALFDLALKDREVAGLEARVAALEEALAVREEMKAS